jgi:oligoribonuclease
MAHEHNSDIVVWIDLEMTGLNPEKHRVIELAAIITNWQYEELATYHAVIKQPKAVLADMDPWCTKQHGSSGLLTQLPRGKKPTVAESELMSLLAEHTRSALPIILAGSSVHFDRRYIWREFPALEKLLHYRMLDVTSWKLIMKSTFGVAYRKREAHRALDDIRGSIQELQYYLELVREHKLA